VTGPVVPLGRAPRMKEEVGGEIEGCCRGGGRSPGPLPAPGSGCAATIRSYLQTAAKHDRNLLGGLTDLFTNGAWLPPDPTPG